MMHLRLKKLLPLFLVVFGLASILGGCTTMRAAKKTISADASDEEKKQFAQELFKEGAELLFVDNEAALEKFAEASVLDPSMVPAHFNAGLAASALNKIDDAIKFYSSCLEQDKEKSACLENLVILQAQHGQVEAAQKLVDQYLADYADSPLANLAAGKLAFALKNYTGAERHARAVIEREAENIEALYLMARIFFERKQYAAAKWAAKNALELSPSHGGLHLLLGHIEKDNGELHDALESYGKAARYFPSQESLESFGLLLTKRGKVAEAVSVFSRLRELYPSVYRNHLHYGNVMMATKKFDEAKDAYQKALELSDGNKEILFNLGLLYFDLKPPGLSEIERLKAAQEYFKAYQSGVSLAKEQQAELNDYLKNIAQKIELEEYAAEAVAEEEEDEADEEMAADDEDGDGSAEALEEDTEPAKEELIEPEPPAPVKALEKPVQKPKAKDELDIDDVFDEEEEEDFFDDL